MINKSMGSIRRSRHRSKFVYNALALFALAAIVLRAIVPVGWMPGTSESGTPIILCTAQGLLEIAVGADGKPVDQGEQESAPHAPPCVFGANANFTTPPDTFEPAPSPAYVQATLGFEPESRPVRIYLRPQQARAPPAIS
jgi:hypothetical protein